MLDFFFHHHILESIEAKTKVDNKAAINYSKLLGFEQKEIVEDGKVLLLELTKENYIKKSAALRNVVLEAAGLYLEPIRGFHGGHRIVCPWHNGHSGKYQTGTGYFEPDEQNDGRGGFVCHQGSCSHRTIADLDWFVVRLLAARGAA